jgi:hypothetical protein
MRRQQLNLPWKGTDTSGRNVGLNVKHGLILYYIGLPTWIDVNSDSHFPKIEARIVPYSARNEPNGPQVTCQDSLIGTLHSPIEQVDGVRRNRRRFCRCWRRRRSCRLRLCCRGILCGIIASPKGQHREQHHPRDDGFARYGHKLVCRLDAVPTIGARAPEYNEQPAFCFETVSDEGFRHVLMHDSRAYLRC